MIPASCSNAGRFPASSRPFSRARAERPAASPSAASRGMNGGIFSCVRNFQKHVLDVARLAGFAKTRQILPAQLNCRILRPVRGVNLDALFLVAITSDFIWISVTMRTRTIHRWKSVQFQRQFLKSETLPARQLNVNRLAHNVRISISVFSDSPRPTFRCEISSAILSGSSPEMIPA